MASGTTLGTGYIQIVPSMEGISSGITKVLNKEGTSAGKSAGDATGNAYSSSFGKMVSAISIGNLISTGVGKAVELISDSVGKATSRLDAMSKSTQVMEILTGSAETAKEVVNQLSDAVTDTAYGLDSASSATQKLATSGMGIEDSTRMIEDLMDAVTFYGDGTNATMTNAADAIAKMTSSGKISADQWQRLIYAGIPVLKIFSEQTGMSISEVSEAFSDGSISAEEFTSTLMTALEEGTESFPSISGKAKEMSGSFETSFANMQARVTTGVANVISAFNTWATDNKLPTIQKVVLNLGTAIKDALGWVAENLPTILDTAIDIFNQWAPVIIAVATAFVALATVIQIQTTIENVTSSATKMFAALAANPIALVIAAIAGLVAGIVYLWNTNEDFRNAVTNIFNAIQTTIGNVVDAIVSFWNDTLIPALQSVGQFFSDIWNGISTTITTVWNTISSVTTTFVNTVKTNVTFAFNAIKTTTSNIWNGIKTTISNVWNGISSTTSNIVNSIKNTVSNVFNTVKSTVSNVWNGIKKAIEDPITNAKNTVHNMIEKIKGFFNFSWSLPKLKLPHVSISGSFSLVPPSVPKFGIEWYAKAMNEPFMLSNATLFGAGEAGNEVVYGHAQLMRDIKGAVASQQYSQGNMSIQKVEINVVAKDNQSAKDIADIVMDRMQHLKDRNDAVFG